MATAIQSKTCRWCDETLHQKQYSSGKWESWQQFARRDFCDIHCLTLYRDDRKARNMIPETRLKKHKGDCPYFYQMEWKLLKNKVKRRRLTCTEQIGKSILCEGCNYEGIGIGPGH